MPGGAAPAAGKRSVSSETETVQPQLRPAQPSAHQSLCHAAAADHVSPNHTDTSTAKYTSRRHSTSAAVLFT